jgi:hypothetical protein
VNTIRGVLELAVFAGSTVEAEVRANGALISCLLDFEAAPAPGTEIEIHALSDDTLVLADVI